MLYYLGVEEGQKNQNSYRVSLDVRAEGIDFINNFELFVLSKENLRDETWTTNNIPYAITGEVTRVSFTNNADSGFFRVMAKRKGEE